jgi:hypothetical protein
MFQLPIHPVISKGFLLVCRLVAHENNPCLKEFGATRVYGEKGWKAKINPFLQLTLMDKIFKKAFIWLGYTQ